MRRTVLFFTAVAVMVVVAAGVALAAVLVGTNGNNTQNGTPNPDRIYGLDGKDTQAGGQGDDYLEGGSAGDTSKGAAEDDLISGGDGQDTLGSELRERGDDVLEGSDGPDTINGGPDQDLIYGGRGSDNLDGNDGADLVNSVDGSLNDTVDGGDSPQGTSDVCVVDANLLVEETNSGCEDLFPVQTPDFP
jgi:Ca2+-binding RTX toxin-like protein